MSDSKSLSDMGAEIRRIRADLEILTNAYHDAVYREVDALLAGGPLMRRQEPAEYAEVESMHDTHEDPHRTQVTKLRS